MKSSLCITALFLGAALAAPSFAETRVQLSSEIERLVNNKEWVGLDFSTSDNCERGCPHNPRNRIKFASNQCGFTYTTNEINPSYAATISTVVSSEISSAYDLDYAVTQNWGDYHLLSFDCYRNQSCAKVTRISDEKKVSQKKRVLTNLRSKNVKRLEKLQTLLTQLQKLCAP